MGEPRCKMEREEDPAAFFRRRALHNFTKAVCNGLFCRIRFYGRSLLYFCALKERERRKGSSEDGVKRNLCHRRTVGIPSFTASAYSISGTSPLPCSCEEESYTLAENRGDNASGGRRGYDFDNVESDKMGTGILGNAVESSLKKIFLREK